MSDNNLYRVGPRKARQYIELCIQSDVVPFLQSSPGVGKSSIMRAIAEKFNLCLIDHRLSTSPPEDMSGLPQFIDGMARFAPFAELFPIKGTKKPINPKTGEEYDGWMIFLDEFNSAKKDTQAAAYKLILDKMVGQHHLHEDVVITCAGNLDSDRAIVNPLGTAMQSRVIHIEMVVNFDEWLMDVALPQKYDERIIAYLSQHKDKLMDFDPKHTNKTFCCPRTWEFKNRLINGREVVDEYTSLYAGTITPGVASSFVQFVKVYAHMPKVEDIIDDPHHHDIPGDVSMLWAVTSALLSNLTEKNIDKISVYVNRLDKSFRILFYRSIMVRYPELRHNQHYTKALVDLQRDLKPRA